MKHSICCAYLRGITMKYLTLTATLLGSLAIAPTANAQLAQFIEDIEATSTIDTVSEYVFRGVSLGSSSVQPGSEFSVYGFHVGSWYSAGFGKNSAVQFDELNLYAGYQLPLSGPLQIDIGGTAYIFPQGVNIFDGSGGTVATYEVDGTVALPDVFLSPSVFAAYDFTLDNFTIEGNISHSFDLPREGWTLDAGLTGGHVELDQEVQLSTIDNVFDSYQYVTASLSANKAITENLSFYVRGNFTVNSEDDVLDFDIDNPISTNFNDDSSVFWFGSGLAINF